MIRRLPGMGHSRQSAVEFYFVVGVWALALKSGGSLRDNHSKKILR